MAEVSTPTTQPGGVKPGIVVKTPPPSGKIQAAPASAAPKKPAFIIKPAGDKERYLKMLIYSDYGVGKTYLAGTSIGVPSMRDVLLLNAESGDLTYDSDDFPFKEIDSIAVTTFKQVARVYEFLLKHCAMRDTNDDEALRKMEAFLKGVDESEIKTPRRYRTVIVDTLSEIEALSLNQLLGVTDANLADEPEAAEWKEYKQNHSMISRLVRSFRNLPMHVIFTCARQYTQDEAKKQIFMPQMTGKLASQVQGFMDLVGYLIVGTAADENTVAPRRLMVQPAARYSAKCRFSKYKKSHFDNPTIGSILQAVGLQAGDDAGKMAKSKAK